MTPRILVAGIGNVFFEDDGFGVEVARRLLEQPPAHALVADFGIRALHLAFELMDKVDLLIAIDVTPRGGAPGTLYVIEPELAHLPLADANAHGMSLPSVFASVRAMGGTLPRVLIVGCEPERTGDGMGLSPKVEAAIAPAAALVRECIEREWGRVGTSGQRSAGLVTDAAPSSGG